MLIRLSAPKRDDWGVKTDGQRRWIKSSYLLSLVIRLLSEYNVLIEGNFKQAKGKTFHTYTWLNHGNCEKNIVEVKSKEMLEDTVSGVNQAQNSSSSPNPRSLRAADCKQPGGAGRECLPLASHISYTFSLPPIAGQYQRLTWQLCI